MIAGVFLAADLAIDAGGEEPLRRLFAQEQMIDAQAGVARPAVPQIAPIGVDRRVGMQRANGVAPALIEKLREAGAGFRLEQRILIVGFGRVDVAIGRHDVIVAGEHDGHAGREQIRGMGEEPVGPGELVGEFRPRLRVAVRRIEGGDQHAIDGGLNVAGLRVLGVAGQIGAGDDRLATARENGNAVPRFLPAPDRAIARFLDRCLRKFTVRGFELLQADDVGPLSATRPGDSPGAY